MSGVLERLARLEAEATAGPWAADPEFDPERPAIYTGLERIDPASIRFDERIAELDSWDRGVEGASEEEAQAIAARDATLIAALRNAAPVLLDIARAVERVAEDHAGTCRHEVTNGAAPCSCGVWDLRAALSRLDEVNLP